MPQGRPHFQLCPFEMPGALEGSAVVLLEAVRLQVEGYWLVLVAPEGSVRMLTAAPTESVLARRFRPLFQTQFPRQKHEPISLTSNATPVCWWADRKKVISEDF